MPGRKDFDVRQPVRHLPTDRIEIFELHAVRHALLDGRHHLAETVERLSRLGEQADIPVKIQPVQVLHLLDDDSRAFRLPDQAVHLGMSFLSVDHNLRMAVARRFVAFMNLALQAEHNGTGRIHNRDVVPPGDLVCRRRFAVRTEQHFLPFQAAELVVPDRP